MRIAALSGLVVLMGTAGLVGAADEDKYEWLEEVEGKKALDWVRQWNRKTAAELEGTSEFQALQERILAILNSRDRIAYPAMTGNHVYNFWQDAEHVRGIWRRCTLADYLGSDPAWETVLDLDRLAKEESENWVYKGSTCLFPEYQRCLVSLSRGGGDAVVVREFDTHSKLFVEGGFTLAEAKSEVSWRDRDSIWVGTDFGEGSLTTSGYPRTARLWQRGKSLEDAPQVFEGQAGDVAAGVRSVLKPEGRYDLASRAPSFFEAHYWLRVDERWVGLDLPRDVQFQDVFQGRLVIQLRSDWQAGGRNYVQGSLLAIDLRRFVEGHRDFEVLFEPTERVSLAGVAATRDFLLLSILDNVRSRIEEAIPSRQGWTRRTLDLPRLGSASIVATDDERSDYFVSYMDFLTPTTLYHVADGVLKPVRRSPSFFNGEGLETRQFEAVSKDGTRIPYFVVRRENWEAHSENPTLLYGYGGFEIPEVPFYSGVTGAAWLEAGGVYALANIRGGGEFGPQWHQAALQKNRHKAYEDFIAVAEDLIARKVTSSRHLGIMGGSNGGLLVGAAFTMRPDLFNAVVCQVPLLDMRRYNKLLAGASWMSEYGNPDDPSMWDYIRTYSPYHNVKPGVRYPKVLFMTSTRDDRVHPGHARKMVALMSEQGHPVIYFENTEGGHAAASNNLQRAHMSALAYTYLWRQLR